MLVAHAAMRRVVRVHPRWGRLGCALATELVLIALGAFAGLSAWRHHRLVREGVTADAEVVMVADRGTRTEVLYRLRVHGRDHWRASLFGQVARWAPVPSAQLDEVKRRGRIAVRYLAADPTVSMPAYPSSAGRSLTQMAAGFGLLALLLPVAIVASWIRVRRQAESTGHATHPLWRADCGPRTF